MQEHVQQKHGLRMPHNSLFSNWMRLDVAYGRSGTSKHLTTVVGHKPREGSCQSSLPGHGW